jgi:superfamily II RNA helicase
VHAQKVHLKHFLPQNVEYHADPASALLNGFLGYVQSKGLDLYPAQEESILAIFDNANVILNTPTGSGKSLVATALHFKSLALGRRSFYTSPIKALANEKFLALAEEFGPENVGMITGDAAVNPEAPIICCTAEILANLALRHGALAPVDDIVMDEFHYYSDKDRGVAWQIPLLTLSKARFLLMSATLGDMSFFEKELSRLTMAQTIFVSSSDRPVPLNFVYQETPIHETIADLVTTNRAPIYLVNFTQRECAEAAQNLMSLDFASKEDKANIAADLEGVRFSSPYGRDIKKILKHGIGIHHAGLLPKYRVVVERLAQKGLLKVICGTDTLGVGINIPIRTVLFSKLCKFDGSKSSILSVRDFKQIAGRAGRRGFDTQGYVVVQAPEHVIDNLRAESKAAGDPKKMKKLVKKKPPEFGFVIWTKDIFQKLIESKPEPLQSRFSVNHGMLVNVLARDSNGCHAMRSLIRDSHESPYAKVQHRKLSFQFFRALLSRKIIEFEPDRTSSKKIRVNLSLQEDFSLFHSLALYLIDTVKLVDPHSPDYALDILTLAESIVENPEVILRKQLDAVKKLKMAQMKMEGVEFDERIAELEKLEYPKPNREFIYSTYNKFVEEHPWMSLENIKPKSIVREMYEGFMTFGEYIREYDLQRSEGLLLRYVAEVYKVLNQTVPSSAKDEEMESIIDYLGGMIRQVDSSLLDEWEKLRNPAYVPQAKDESESLDIGAADITRNKREFMVSIRNEAFYFVKTFSNQRFEELADWVKDSAGISSSEYDVAYFKGKFEAYRSEHEGPLFDRLGRDPKHIVVVPKQNSPNQLDGETWAVQQTLVDTEGYNDVLARFSVSLDKCRKAGRVFLEFEGFDF